MGLYDFIPSAARFSKLNTGVGRCVDHARVSDFEAIWTLQPQNDESFCQQWAVLTTCHYSNRLMTPLRPYFIPLSPLPSSFLLKTTHPSVLFPYTQILPPHNTPNNGTTRPTPHPPPFLSEHPSHQFPSLRLRLRFRSQRNPLLLLPPPPHRSSPRRLLHRHLAARSRHRAKDNIRVRSASIAGLHVAHVHLLQ
jgi:hypothetical protein